jgi:hypothetical protein
MATWTPQDIRDADAAGQLQAGKPDLLVAFLREKGKARSSLSGQSILSYFLAAICIVVGLSLIGFHWDKFGSLGHAVLLGILAGGGTVAAFRLRDTQQVSAGIFAAIAVAATPFTIYFVQEALGMWPKGITPDDFHRIIHPMWLMMEFGTLAVALVLLQQIKMPFTMASTVLVLLWMAMDLTVRLVGWQSFAENFKVVAFWAGIATLFVALRIEYADQSRRDLAYWVHIGAFVLMYTGIVLHYKGAINLFS